MSDTRLRRRGVLALGVGAFVLAATPLAILRRSRRVRRTVPVMGTLAEFVVVHGDPHEAQSAIDAAIRALHAVDRSMSRFRADSDVGRANSSAGQGPVRVSPATAAVVAQALGWAEASDGAFDPCVGRAAALWEVTRRSAPPHADRVARLAGRKLYRGLEVDRHQGHAVVRLAERDAALDLGGIAKGFAVDRAAAALRARGVTSALVNVGGDLVAIGGAEDGEDWRIGVRSPHDPSELIGKLRVRDAAVATSGDYERFFRHGGRRYHHLLDPSTAAPRESSTHSVTILAGDCVTADAAATAAFGANAEDARALLARVAPAARIVSEVGA